METLTGDVRTARDGAELACGRNALERVHSVKLPVKDGHYQVVPFARMCRLVIDAGRIAWDRPIIRGLFVPT